MRIIFIGAVEFSRSTLEWLLSSNANVVGICTLKSSPLNADHVDLGYLGAKYAIPTYYVNEINSHETLSWIKELDPDVIFCFGWSHLLRRDLLNLAPIGVIGFHPSELPSNRGRHPIIWSLVLGLDWTASTFFFMNEGADTGDILSQKKLSIDAEDDASTLYKKITTLAISQIKEFLPMLTTGNYKRIKQDESRASNWRKRNRADGVIDWRMSAKSIHNLVRGLTRPYIGAIFMYGDLEITLWKSKIIKEIPINLEPGKILKLSNEGIVVKCGEHAICLIETEPNLNAEVGTYLS